MATVTRLIEYYKFPVIGAIAQRLVLRKGADIPRHVQIGEGCTFPHNALGTVLHPNTVLGQNVKIYQNETIGRGDIWKPYSEESNLKFDIQDGAILCAGCKILCSEGTITVGKNTVIAANAVLTRSTGESEIWAGVPARKIRNLE